MESYLELVIAVDINLKDMFDSPSKYDADNKEIDTHMRLSLVMAYVLFALTIFLPIWGFRFLHSNFDQIKKEQAIERKILFGHNTRKKEINKWDYMPLTKSYGAFYEGFNARNVSMLSFNVVFLVRRFLFGAVLVFVKAWPAIQIQLLMLIGVFFIVFIGSIRPFHIAS